MQVPMHSNFTHPFCLVFHLIVPYILHSISSSDLMPKSIFQSIMIDRLDYRQATVRPFWKDPIYIKRKKGISKNRISVPSPTATQRPIKEETYVMLTCLNCCISILCFHPSCANFSAAFLSPGGPEYWLTMIRREPPPFSIFATLW
jgi:hypothetical protein